jgi:hypothetical protein
MSLRRILDRIFPVRVIRREHAEWARRGFAAPSPPHVKRATLLRLGLPEATWIEKAWREPKQGGQEARPGPQGGPIYLGWRK